LLKNRLDLKRANIEIDLSNDLFENKVKESNILEIINEQSPQNIVATECNPKEISVQFEESIKKKIPLIVPKLLTFMQGYDIKKEISITPDSIVVTGPVSIIDTLNMWYTDTIKHTNLSSIVKDKVNTKEILANVIFNHYTIEYEIDVAQYTEKKLSANIKVINNKNIELLIVPKKVDLKCLIPISEYDKITAEDFSIIADYQKNKVNGYINLKLNKKAKFSKNISYFPESVEYIQLKE